jgi:hypothetical protein
MLQEQIKPKKPILKLADTLSDGDSNEIDEKDGPINLFDAGGNKKSQTTLLIEIGEKHLLFHDDTNDAFVEITKHKIKKTIPVRSRDFRELLSFELYKLTAKGANATAIADAIATLEAKAKFSGDKLATAVRVLWLVFRKQVHRLKFYRKYRGGDVLKRNYKQINHPVLNSATSRE